MLELNTIRSLLKEWGPPGRFRILWLLPVGFNWELLRQRSLAACDVLDKDLAETAVLHSKVAAAQSVETAIPDMPEGPPEELVGSDGAIWNWEPCMPADSQVFETIRLHISKQRDSLVFLQGGIRRADEDLAPLLDVARGIKGEAKEHRARECAYQEWLDNVALRGGG